MTDRTIRLRGLPEWLIRKYLVELGAASNETPSAVTAPGWRAEWTSSRVAVAGSATLGLTEFAITFAGLDDTLEGIVDAFMKKAQRGGG